MQQEGLQMHPLPGVNMDMVDGVIIGYCTSCPFPGCQKQLNLDFPMSDESLPGSQSSHKGVLSVWVVIVFLILSLTGQQRKSL